MRYNLECSRTKRVLALLIALPAFFLAGNAPAQEAPVMQSLMGEWEGTGTLFAFEASFSMKWEWVLSERFVRLTFQNRMQSDDGTERVLEAEAFYKPSGADRYEGTWFDSRGVVQPLQGDGADSVLTVLWGTPETEQGRTVYRVLGTNQVEVEDSVLKGDQWHPFGHAIYRRR